MTYAISYKKAMDRIEENEVTQNYLDNMTQWGNIFNLLFLSIQIISAASIAGVYMKGEG